MDDAVGVRADGQAESGSGQPLERGRHVWRHGFPQVVLGVVGPELVERALYRRVRWHASPFQHDAEVHRPAIRIVRSGHALRGVDGEPAVRVRGLKRIRGHAHAMTRQRIADALEVREDQDTAGVERQEFQGHVKPS